MEIKQLEDSIANLSLMEAAQLVSRLENRLGVSAAAQALPSLGPTTQQAPVVEEQTEFAVVLKEVGPTKINVIKVVREVTSLGLKEAKDVTDELPKTIKEGLSREAAASIAKKFTDAGGVVEIK